MSRIDAVGVRLADRPRLRGAVAAILVTIPAVAVVMLLAVLWTLATHVQGFVPVMALICGLVLIDAAICGAMFGTVRRAGLRPRAGRVVGAMAMVAVITGDLLYVSVTVLPGLFLYPDGDPGSLLAFAFIAVTAGLVVFGLPALLLTYPHARAWDALIHRWNGLPS